MSEQTPTPNASTNTSTNTPRPRPLSPHLQVYKPQMTSVLSILHRATGVALAVGTLMVVWWLIAAATSQSAYYTAQNFAGSPLGTALIFGWSVALFYHLSNGIRHLFWDLGYCLDIKSAYRAGYMVLASTVILTIAAWGIALTKSDGRDYPATQEFANNIGDDLEGNLIEEIVVDISLEEEGSE